MKLLEQFNPNDAKYKKVEDLPEKERQNFKKYGDGFVNKDAIDLDKAEEEALEIKKIANSRAEEGRKSPHYFDYLEADRIVSPIILRKDNEELTRNLSPEIIENIMSKVQDLNTEGVCFTNLESSHNRRRIFRAHEGKNDFNIRKFYNVIFKKIFKEGLLGKESGGETIDKEKWADKIRKTRGKTRTAEAGIYFNIVGRIDPEWLDKERRVYNEENKSSREPLEMSKVKGIYSHGFPLLILDLSFAKNMIDECKSIHSVEKYGTFGATLPDESRLIENKKVVNPDYGFSLVGRVAPRFFKGLVLAQNYDLDRFLKIILKDSEINKKNLFPIYNQFGDLIWPNKMKYAEIKSLVKQKNKSKD